MSDAEQLPAALEEFTTLRQQVADLELKLSLEQEAHNDTKEERTSWEKCARVVTEDRDAAIKRKNELLRERDRIIHERDDLKKEIATERAAREVADRRAADAAAEFAEECRAHERSRTILGEQLHEARDRRDKAINARARAVTETLEKLQAASAERIRNAWVVRHLPSETWWRAKRSGYCRELIGAGIYSEEEAQACARTRSLRANGTREDRAERLLDAIAGLEDGTVGALMGLLAWSSTDSTEEKTGA